MCQEQYTTNEEKFKQLTYKERIKIETLYNDQHLNYPRKILNFKTSEEYYQEEKVV